MDQMYTIPPYPLRDAPPEQALTLRPLVELVEDLWQAREGEKYHTKQGYYAGHDYVFGSPQKSNEFHCQVIGKRGKGIVFKAVPKRLNKSIARFHNLEEHRGISKLFSESFSLVYYPSPDDLLPFARSGYETTAYAPGTFFPGSLGVLSGHRKKMEREVSLTYIQGSCRIGEAQILTANELRKYGGWKERLCRTLFEMAGDNRWKEINCDPWQNTRHFPLLQRLAKEYSFSWEEDKTQALMRRN
ncbi:hypothetical protein J4210_06640 [Candidatus Woesearchaeota archaeon]|nr:hypothetical protein [Candidatus Woesearchaeota archaeon]